MNQFCTIVDTGYLERVWALDESRRTWCGEFPLNILALDEYSADCLERLKLFKYTEGVRLWHWNELMTRELMDARLDRNYSEWVWTLKPYWILHLMRNLERWTSLTYIDGDTRFFNRPSSMFDELGDHDIGITPHRFSQNYIRYGINGRFNGAFVHVKNTRNALSCITHWAAQCLRRCSLEHGEGSFVDQKYLDPWPERWRARALEHKGVNLAPWNQGGDHYSYKIVGGNIMVDDDPLVLYHYHGGPTTAYPLDPFIRKHVYQPYVDALEESRRIMRLCVS